MKKLFSEDLNLSMEMAFDFKELYKNTNDSTYIKTKLKFSSIAGVIDSMDIRIRARGNFRKKNMLFQANEN